MIHSYSSPLNLGHKLLDDFWSVFPVVIQEKVDGSQFSFMKDRQGELHFKSHKSDINHLAPGDHKMFAAGIEEVKMRADALEVDHIYRCEYLQKPKHNTIYYSRVPLAGLYLFDVEMPGQHYLEQVALVMEAARLGLECANVFAILETKPSLEYLQELLKKTSILGGAVIEGIVLKNYNLFGPDHKVMMAKLVNASFKEDNKVQWAAQKDDIEEVIAKRFGGQPRWRKAIQHLRENGQLQNAPQDIPLLLKEIVADVENDAWSEIKDMLYKHHWRNISRRLIKGFPEFYKNILAAEALGYTPELAQDDEPSLAYLLDPELPDIRP